MHVKGGPDNKHDGDFKGSNDASDSDNERQNGKDAGKKDDLSEGDFDTPGRNMNKLFYTIDEVKE